MSLYLQGEGSHLKIVSGDLHQSRILVRNGEFGIWFRSESTEIEVRGS
jgi:hypothetical protein